VARGVGRGERGKKKKKTYNLSRLQWQVQDFSVNKKKKKIIMKIPCQKSEYSSPFIPESFKNILFTFFSHQTQTVLKSNFFCGEIFNISENNIIISGIINNVLCFFVQCQISQCTLAIRLMIGNGHLHPPNPNPKKHLNMKQVEIVHMMVVTNCNAFNYRAKLSWQQNERKKASRASRSAQ
jgi:hypothetical protein